MIERPNEMNQKTSRPARMPAYLREFKCIGTACEDNCCIGWDVEFDKKSFRKYMKIKDVELSKLFDRCVYINRHSFSSDVDYAKVRLGKDKRCPFLNEMNLCRIQATLGEEYLSNVCASFPRYTNEINGMLEHSANMSCPEAARLALLKPDGIRFLDVQEGLASRHIVSMAVNTGDKGLGCLVRFLPEIRDFTIALIQNRDFTLTQRLMILGRFFEELQRLADTKRTGAIPKLIGDMRRKIENGSFSIGRESDKGDPAFKLKLMRELVDRLNVFTEVDSRRYVALMEEVLKGIQYNRKASPQENMKRYALAGRQYFDPFMREHGYILENYLVNFVFGCPFPALEVQRPFDAYIMLVLLYSLLEFHLTGLAACRRGLTGIQAVEFIQVFSKTVEHHKTYLESITEYAAKKRFNTLGHMEALLADHSKLTAAIERKGRA